MDSKSYVEATPVLLLKTKSTPHDGYAEYFSSTDRRHSYRPIFVPVLEHIFDHDSLSQLRDLFISRTLGKKYGGLVFTSQRAVEGFRHMILEEVSEDIASEVSRNLSLYTVGPATYRSLNNLRQTHLPHTTLIGEDAGTGEALARQILEHYNNLPQNQLAGSSHENEQNETGKLPLLFLVGEVHRDIIPMTLMSSNLPPEQRIQLDKLIVYRTGVMESFREDFASTLKELDVITASGTETNDRENQQSRPPVWVVVFSPTGCDAMVDILGLCERDSTDKSGPLVSKKKDTCRRNCYIATIGPTTRDHIRQNFGVEPDICAEKPSPEGVGEGIESFTGYER